MKLLPTVYHSVSEVIRANADSETADEIISAINARVLVSALNLLRVKAGITQAEVAEGMGCQHAKVSKLERGQDATLSLGDVVAYSRAIGKGIKLVIGDGEGLTVEIEGRVEPTDQERVRN